MATMLDKLRRLLGTETPNTAEAIESALAEIDIEALREKQSRIAAERQALLLISTDAQILEAEERLNVARLDVERAQLAIDELTTRLTAARIKEVEDNYLAAHRAAAEAREAWASKARKELPKIERSLASIFEDGKAVAHQLRQLHELSRPHEFSGDTVDQQPYIPMPGEEFAHRANSQWSPDPFEPWLMVMLRDHHNLPKI